MVPIAVGLAFTVAGLIWNVFAPIEAKLDWQLVIMPLVLGWIGAAGEVLCEARNRR